MYSLRGKKEVQRIKLISPEPKLALRMGKRTPILMRPEVYHTLIGWVEDVGSKMRERETIVNTIATGLMSLPLYIPIYLRGERVEEKGYKLRTGTP